MKQLLHGALHGWLSQLQQQRHALVACFALGDVDSLINATAGDAAALAATSTPVSNVVLQTASIDTFIHMMTSPPSAPAASAAAASVSVAACVKFSRENLLYAAVGCRTVLVREAAAAASAVSASAGVRAAVESEVAQLRQQIQEQQQQMKQHEEQQVASMKLYQVRVSFALLFVWHSCHSRGPQDQVKQQQHQNEELQKQLQLQQKQQPQQPQKVDSKQKQSKLPTKGVSPSPVTAAAAVPVVDLHQQQQIDEMTQQLRSYEAEIEDLKGQLQV